MIPRQDDWVDRLARRSVQAGRPLTAATATGDATADEPPEERFTRASAVKLVLLGAAAIALGRSAPPAQAAERGGCFAECLDSHEKALKRQLSACRDVFVPDFIDRTKADSWERLKAMFAYGFLENAAASSLAGLCYGKAKLNYRSGLDDCYRRCERKQPPSPPPNSAPPPVPPAPSLNDPCAACAQVGGICCGSPEPGKPPCGCAGYIPADGSSPCARIGC